MLAVEFEYDSDPLHDGGLLVNFSLGREFRRLPRVVGSKERKIPAVLKNRMLLRPFSTRRPTDIAEEYEEDDDEVVLSLPSCVDLEGSVMSFLSTDQPDPARSLVCNQLAAFVMSALAAAIALPASDFVGDPKLPCDVSPPRPRVVSLALKTQGSNANPTLAPVSPNRRSNPVGSHHVFGMGRRVVDGPIQMVGLTGRNAICSIAGSRDDGESLARNSCLDLAVVMEYYQCLMPDQPDVGKSVLRFPSFVACVFGLTSPFLCCSRV